MTYQAKTINQIPDLDRLEVIDACTAAMHRDHLVLVLMEYERVDSVYTNDADWVENYYRSGGFWEYMCPRKFLYG